MGINNIFKSIVRYTLLYCQTYTSVQLYSKNFHVARANNAISHLGKSLYMNDAHIWQRFSM